MPMFGMANPQSLNLRSRSFRRGQERSEFPIKSLHMLWLLLLGGCQPEILFEEKGLMLHAWLIVTNHIVWASNQKS